MLGKQEINGKKGERRTENILLEHFSVLQRTPDVDGADFIVELRYDSIEQLRESKEKIRVNGIIQAKFFEGRNEVKIAKEYIEDNEGIRTDFFTLIHTDDENENEICYFFTAKEIKEQFRLRPQTSKNKEHYIFKLTRERKFEKNKNLPKSEINLKIEHGIKSTEEFRNQQFIKKIEEGLLNPTTKLVDDSNEELFKRIENMHIVDKLHEALTVYDDFNNMIPWRLAEKISFKEKPSTSTYYNRYTLSTTNSEIINFFNSIEINSDVKISKPVFFKGVKKSKEKARNIVEKLNKNAIVWLDEPNTKEPRDIRVKDNAECDCVKCNYYGLNFSRIKELINEKDKLGEDWDEMLNAYVYFHLGDFEKAGKIYTSLYERAKVNKEGVFSLLTLYNRRITCFHSLDPEYPNLPTELKKINVSDEKTHILESLANNSMFSDYFKSIDELYLKIKDYKQRRIVNNTSNLINRLYAKIIEYHVFMDGNYLLENRYDQYEIMVEKVIESVMLSYSMNTGYTEHVNSVNDFFIQMTLHHCDPSKLLGYFQRNSISELNYETDKGYLDKCIKNFFSKENVDFIQSEIVYVNNRTGNPNLRKKVKRIFENICILIAYLNVVIKKKGFLPNVTYFIEKLDFNVHEVSLLAKALLKKPEFFSANEILHLLRILIKKENFSQGYLITNCLICLKIKEYKFDSDDKLLVDSLRSLSLLYPKYGIVNVLPALLLTKNLNVYKKEILRALAIEFNPVLYYEAVMADCLEEPLNFFDAYLDFLEPFIHKQQEATVLFNIASPYTGLSWSLRKKLNNLMEVIYKIDQPSLFENPVLNKVAKQYPYYNFICRLDSFHEDDPFDMNWVLENQSEIILSKIVINKNIKTRLKAELEENFNQEVSKIYIKYFA